MTNLATIKQSQATGEFVRQLFAVLARTEVRYCVLHGWDELPDTVSSDLDIVVHPSDFGKLQTVFAEMAEAGYKWIQCRHYAGCSYRFDFAWFEGKRFHVVGVDCISEYRYAGLILRSGQDLLKGRRQFRDFWIAGTETAFAYMLMKKTLKGSISAEQIVELQAMCAELGVELAKKLAYDTFGTDSNGVVDAIADRSFPAQLPKLRASLVRTLLKRNPGMWLRYHAAEKFRLIMRWMRPTGVILVALGPDGVGKSTLLQRIVENFKPAFRSIHFFHYRATFGQSSQIPVVNPHSSPPHGVVLSIARLVVWFFEFWLSYVFIVRPKLGRSGLIVFDRYFHDLLVDVHRYRYAGPDWLPRVMLQLMPNAHLLLLVLDAEESVIQSRKKEVSIDRLHKLRDGYKRLVLTIPNSALIHTDQALDETATAATEAVYQHLLRRESIRHPEWTKGYVANVPASGAAA